MIICCAGESAKGKTDCRQNIQTNGVLMSDLKKPTLEVKHIRGKILMHWRKTAEEKYRSVLYCRQKSIQMCTA
jgi:hypothetical protein